MSWADYERLVKSQWTDLLETTCDLNELRVHSFLEQHPCMVPGAFNLIGGSSGHYPHFSVLVSQPPLPSYDRRLPDFLWLSTNSAIDEPVLVEIESPARRWFTASGEQTADLTHALGQISEWKAWFNEPRNVDAFKALYRLERDSWHGRRFRPSYLLIYGRRHEANATPKLMQKRGYLHAEDIVSMTFDRLGPDPNANQIISVKVDVNGVFRAISVPPTLTWSPTFAEDRAHIQDLAAAIERNAYIGAARKKFLIQRLAYWNEWATERAHGIMSFEEE